MGFLESKYHVTSLRRQGLLEENPPDQSVQFPGKVRLLSIGLQ